MKPTRRQVNINGNCCSLTIAVISTLPPVQLACPIFNYPEAISSINAKLEMAKNIYLKMRKHFAFAMGTHLLSVRDKHYCRVSKFKMKKLQIWMDVFCHFKFCINRRNHFQNEFQSAASIQFLFTLEIP